MDTTFILLYLARILPAYYLAHFTDVAVPMLQRASMLTAEQVDLIDRVSFIRPSVVGVPALAVRQLPILRRQERGALRMALSTVMRWHLRLLFNSACPTPLPAPVLRQEAVRP